MKIPRDVFGRTLADHLIRNWDYRAGQTLPIPAHKPLRIGTLAAIVRMVSDHKQVSREEILRGL